jgi:hypothetical protein
MSSSGWGKLFAQDGLFSTDITVNPWANANMVRATCVGRGLGHTPQCAAAPRQRDPHRSARARVSLFAACAQIFVKYCSSDSWFGDAGNSSSTFGFSFRGARLALQLSLAVTRA